MCRALESVNIVSALAYLALLVLPFAIYTMPCTHARSESINDDSLKLQLLTARKKEWWPATVDSLPQQHFTFSLVTNK